MKAQCRPGKSWTPDQTLSLAKARTDELEFLRPDDLENAARQFSFLGFRHIAGRQDLNVVLELAREADDAEQAKKLDRYCSFAERCTGSLDRICPVVACHFTVGLGGDNKPAEPGAECVNQWLFAHRQPRDADRGADGSGRSA